MTSIKGYFVVYLEGFDEISHFWQMNVGYSIFIDILKQDGLLMSGDGFVMRYVTAYSTASVGNFVSLEDFAFLIAAWEDLQVQHDIQHLAIQVPGWYEDFELSIMCGFCNHVFGSGFEDWYGGVTGVDGNEMGSRGVRSCATRGGGDVMLALSSESVGSSCELRVLEIAKSPLSRVAPPQHFLALGCVDDWDEIGLGPGLGGP